MSQDFTTNAPQLTAAFRQQFHDSFEIESRLSAPVLASTIYRRGSIAGSSFTINDMGALKMKKTTSRFQDTELSLPEVGTRMAPMADYDLHVLIEPRYLSKLSTNPQSKYMKAMLSAKNEQEDEIAYRAMLDTVLRKQAENSLYAPVALPNTQIILDGGTGFTKAKLIQARKLFRKNKCDEKNGEKLYIAYTADMLGEILADTTLTSADYLAGKMLQEGALASTWMGFTWIPYEEVDLDEPNTVATTVAWCGSAIHMGDGSSFGISTNVRADKNNCIQLSLSASWGAGRANEKKIVAIKSKY